MPACRPAGERLAYGHRAVDELRLRRDERHGDTVAGEVAQGERGLQPGDATADDQHAERIWGMGVGGHDPPTTIALTTTFRYRVQRVLGKEVWPHG